MMMMLPGAEVDLLDPGPDNASAYRVEYSLRAQLFEEPRMRDITRDMERGREEEAPKGISFFSTLIVFTPPSTCLHYI
jgi:hypothetical protein